MAEFSRSFHGTAKIPPGGYKIQCGKCKKILKTRPDLSKEMCGFIARSNGWREKSREKSWRCPECIK